jgi:hypothetical protein
MTEPSMATTARTGANPEGERGGAAAEALSETVGTAVFAGLTKAQREIAEFVSERIRQDLESQTQLLRCRTLEEVLDVQSRFLSTAMDQYAAEASRLARIGAEIMGSAQPRH